MQQLPILTRGVIVALAALILAIAATVGLLFRAGAVAGARTTDAPPEPPTAVAAEALTASLVHVEWAAPARADGYEVVTTDSRGTGLKSDPVKGAVTAFDVEIPQAKPATQYCFQVVALRGEGLRSGASEKSCATTLTTTLKPPTDVSVTPGEAGPFQVSWKGEKKNSHTVLVDGAPAAPTSEAGPGAKALRIQIPGGEHCVTVVAVDGEEASEPSEPACVEGVGPSPTPSVAEGGGPAGPAAAPRAAARRRRRPARPTGRPRRRPHRRGRGRRRPPAAGRLDRPDARGAAHGGRHPGPHRPGLAAARVRAGRGEPRRCWSSSRTWRARRRRRALCARVRADLQTSCRAGAGGFVDGVTAARG